MTTSCGPKVAVVLAGRWGKPMSIDLGGYCDTLSRLGYQPILVCCGNDGGEGDFPVIISKLEELEEESFSPNFGIERAILFNWLKTPRVVAAMKRAGAAVISRCDMDGQASARVFPWATWQVSVSSPGSLSGRIRRTKHWLHRVVSLSRQEDAALLQT